MTASSRLVLVVDDDERLCASLADGLTEPGLEVVHALTGAQALELCRRRRPDVVLLDQNLPDGPGARLCPGLLSCNDRAKIVFMTAYPSFENALEALKAGASDYLAKPFELGELRLAVRNALRVSQLERIEQLHERDRRLELERSVFVGASPSLEQPLHLAAVAASSAAPVLITGETGTGKTLLARWIHYNGARSDGPFVSLNCAALPDTLAESELFGHEKGAFTGATGPRRGVFEMAERGTVLLDEIGAMPVQLQAKLLGVLEHRSLRRLGSETERAVQARVVAATNSDLETAIREGSFRKDLYFRLGVIQIGLPRLRDRLDDLPDLCRHLTRSIAGHEVPLAEGELARLAAYPWPGNVRELASVLERALLIRSGDRLAPSALLAASGGALAAPPDRQAADETGCAEPVLRLETVERQHIVRTLAHFRGNLTHTAAALGIALSTLKRKVRDHGLGAAGRE